MDEVSISQKDWRAGGIADCMSEWYKITADPAVLNVVEY